MKKGLATRIENVGEEEWKAFAYCTRHGRVNHHRQDFFTRFEVQFFKSMLSNSFSMSLREDLLESRSQIILDGRFVDRLFGYWVKKRTIHGPLLRSVKRTVRTSSKGEIKHAGSLKRDSGKFVLSEDENLRFGELKFQRHALSKAANMMYLIIEREKKKDDICRSVVSSFRESAGVSQEFQEEIDASDGTKRLGIKANGKLFVVDVESLKRKEEEKNLKAKSSKEGGKGNYPKTKKRYKCKLKDLLDTSILEAGIILVFRGIPARLLEDGRIACNAHTIDKTVEEKGINVVELDTGPVLKNEKLFTSLSSWAFWTATTVLELPPSRKYDGWKVVWYKGKKLEEYRDVYLKRKKTDQ